MFHTSSNPTSGEFWAAHFYRTGVLRQVAVPMRLPDAGRRIGRNLPEAGLLGFWDNVTSECCSEHYVWLS